MERKLVLRGLTAGGIAGVLAFVFARIFAEPVIDRAIAYEDGRDAAQNALLKAAGQAADPAGPDIFSRTTQSNVGIGVGIIGFGLAMGALFAVAYVILGRRTTGLSPRVLALLLAGAGFVGMYFVPYLKYPANPPAIGHEETIHTRGQLYLAMLAISLVTLILAVTLATKLGPRLGWWNAVPLATLAYAVVIGVAIALLPQLGHLSYNVATYGRHSTETPLPLTDSSGHIVFPGFPADVLFQFRFYSLMAQVLLWSSLGLVFGALAERVLKDRAEDATVVPAPDWAMA